MNESLCTWKEHEQCVYQTIWNPRSSDVFASCSGDRQIKLWDVRQPKSLQTIVGHSNEVLALDWNKYCPDQIVSSGVDKAIRSWDLRMPAAPLSELYGHDFAIRRLKCSPHSGDLVGTVSYDMTFRLWNIANPQQIFVHDKHTEFVLGLDFSLFQPGLVATCAWDETVHIFST